jgi:DeoR/GlpR family transcriptional regulator of sugar metabolism
MITNALPILAELSSAEGFELISLGGLVRSHSLAMIGPQTVANLRALHADRAFLGATGVTLRGLSTPNLIEAETKAAMVAAAESCAALVDHSKVGSSSLAPFAPWEALDHFVTDAPLPRDLGEHLKACGVRVVCAEPVGAL